MVYNSRRAPRRDCLVANMARYVCIAALALCLIITGECSIHISITNTRSAAWKIRESLHHLEPHYRARSPTARKYAKVSSCRNRFFEIFAFSNPRVVREFEIGSGDLAFKTRYIIMNIMLKPSAVNTFTFCVA